MRHVEVAFKLHFLAAATAAVAFCACSVCISIRVQIPTQPPPAPLAVQPFAEMRLERSAIKMQRS